LTLGILIGVAYGVWLAKGESRAFRVGFLCWAVVYFVLFKKIFDVGLSDLISSAFVKLNIRANFPYNMEGFTFPEPPVFGERGLGQYLYPNFHLTCHSLLMLLMGLVGGWVTVYFYRRRERTLRQHHVAKQ
jgi:hypothetical protein